MNPSQKLPPNEYQGDNLIAIATTFIILDIVFVALRIWSRKIQRTKFRNDDLFVIAGLFVIIGTCITSFCAVKLGGVGHHLQYVPKDQRIQWLRTSYIVAPCLYITSASLPKLAVVCMYLKIFEDKLSRLCCYFIVFALVVTPLIFVPMLAFQCTPTSYLWDKTILGGHCLDQAMMFRYGSLPNIITDVGMLVLPMPLIWKLHASMKVKVGLLITFLLGSIGLITSILRFIAFFESLKDGTWVAVPLLSWVIIEPSIYLWAACLLSYKPLLKYLIHESSLSRIFTRSRSSSKSTRIQINLPGRQASLRNVARLPSDDGGSDNQILRTHELSVETSSRTDEEFAMHSIPSDTTYRER